MYGKFAQSLGHPKYSNSIYASLVTSGCRTMILDAIATHPGGIAEVLMVATDGVFFRTEHPFLDLGGQIGQWERTQRENLTLFKPGIYWDDSARERLRRSENPRFKSRGVSAREFGKRLGDIDSIYRNWSEADHQFPSITYNSEFSMISPLQAIQRGDWGLCGKILNDRDMTQNSDPASKRDGLYYDPEYDMFRSRPWADAPEEESVAYDKTFGRGDLQDPEEWGLDPDGYVLDMWKGMLK
jgi:hypothetical protein